MPKVFRIEGFSAEDETAIKAAAEEWSSYGHPIIISPRGTSVIVRTDVAAEKREAAGVYRDRAGGTEFIAIADNAYFRSYFPDWSEHVRQTALHEMGHALGLHDSGVPSELMSGFAQCEIVTQADGRKVCGALVGEAEHVTQGDLDAFSR
jgi:predicted Zn-dependent protease